MADEYQIASGHNQAGSLVNIDSITPSGDRVFIAPVGWYTFSNGRQRVKADGSFYHSGFRATVWKFGALTNAQYDYLYDNYFDDSSNGNAVTIRTRGNDGAYANYNARLLLPPRADLRVDQAHPNLYFQDVEVRFIRLEAI